MTIRLPRAPMIFGGMDGLTVAMGLIAGLTLIHASRAAIFGAALSGGLAELPGMAAGQWKSAREEGVIAALACGLSSCLFAVAPGLPFLFLPGHAALAAAGLIAAGLAAAVTALSPSRGPWAFAETYGLLISASALCVAGGFIPH